MLGRNLHRRSPKNGGRSRPTRPNRVDLFVAPDEVAKELGEYSQKLDAELSKRHQRLERTEDKIRGLIDFIAQGDHSDYVAETMRDLEAHAKAEKAAIANLESKAGEPLRLPSIDEVSDQVFNLDTGLMADPIAGRGRLRQWLQGEEVRLIPGADGTYTAEGTLLPLVVLNQSRKELQRPNGALWSNVCSGGRI